MRLPFQTFTQRDVPQTMVARPEQFQAGPAPVAPSLAANTQLQQVKAVTGLVDSIVGAVNSYNNMNQAFEEKAERERLKAERDLAKANNDLAASVARELEPQVAKIRQDALLGKITGAQGIEQANKLYKERLGENQEALNILLDNERVFRGDMRGIDTRNILFGQDENLDALAIEQDGMLSQLFQRYQQQAELNPDEFNFKVSAQTFQAQKNALLNQYTVAVNQMQLSDAEKQKRINSRKKSLENIGNNSNLLFAHAAAKLEQAHLSVQADILFQTEFQKRIAELKQNPPPPNVFKQKVNEIVDIAEKTVLGDPRLENLNATNRNNFRQKNANDVLAASDKLYSENFSVHQETVKTSVQAKVSMMINDQDASGEYQGRYQPYSGLEEGPVDRIYAKRDIRIEHQRLLDAGAYGPPESEAAQSAYAAVVSADLSRFDDARVGEWMQTEYDGVDATLKELEKGGDGAFPNLDAVTRERRIEEARRRKNSLLTEMQAGNSKPQKLAKKRADDLISDLASGAPEVPGEMIGILRDSGLDPVTQGSYLQQEEYARWWASTKAQYGGLERLSKKGLEELKAYVDVTNWETVYRVADEDKIYSGDLREKLQPKFIAEIDDMIKRRAADPAQFANDEMDRIRVGEEGRNLDPDRIKQSVEMQFGYDPTARPSLLTKETATQIKDVWSGTADGPVPGAVVDGMLLPDEPAIARGGLVSKMGSVESEAGSVNLIRELARTTGEKESVLRLYGDFYDDNNPRNLGYFHQASTMDGAKFAEVNNIDRKVLFTAMDGEEMVDKVIGALPDYGDVNSSARIKEVLSNYALVIKSKNPGVSDSEIVRRAAEDVLEVMGGNFAQSSALGDGYVPIPKGESARDWENALADVSYWTESKRGEIKSAMGTDVNVINAQALISGTKANWAWKAVGDGTSYQLYAADSPTPIIVTQQEVAARIAELDRTPAPSDAARRFPGRSGVTSEPLTPRLMQ